MQQIVCTILRAGKQKAEVLAGNLHLQSPWIDLCPGAHRTPCMVPAPFRREVCTHDPGLCLSGLNYFFYPLCSIPLFKSIEQDADGGGHARTARAQDAPPRGSNALLPERELPAPHTD